uniref:PiggyBac transposable element-derived protein domain-containing protein n=1 Tax=Graphocephala atropunctata TaxID=36148 RepID=A0A1B6L1F0_9HEMI
MTYRKDLQSDAIHSDEEDNLNSDLVSMPDSADELFDIDSEHNSDIDIDNTVDNDEDPTAEDLQSEGEEYIVDEKENNQSEGNKWRKWVAADVSFKEFKFSDNSGFKPPPGFDRYSVLKYFSLFFTDELLEQIVNETNRYANEKINKNRPLR